MGQELMIQREGHCGVNSNLGSAKLVNEGIHKYIELRCEGCDEAFCSWFDSRNEDLRYKQRI